MQAAARPADQACHPVSARTGLRILPALRPLGLVMPNGRYRSWPIRLSLRSGHCRPVASEEAGPVLHCSAPPDPPSNNGHGDELRHWQWRRPSSHAPRAAGADREFEQCRSEPNCRPPIVRHRCTCPVAPGKQCPANKFRRDTPSRTARASWPKWRTCFPLGGDD